MCFVLPCELDLFNPPPRQLLSDGVPFAGLATGDLAGVLKDPWVCAVSVALWLPVALLNAGGAFPFKSTNRKDGVPMAAGVWDWGCFPLMVKFCGGTHSGSNIANNSMYLSL